MPAVPQRGAPPDMASSAPRVTPVVAHRRKARRLPLRIKLAQARKASQELKETKERLAKLREMKLKLESTIERSQAEKEELKLELRDRNAYAERLETILDRNQHYLDKCMKNLDKIGPVPIAHCSDCGTPYPITHFKLNISQISTAKNWTIISYCKSCLHERNKKIDVKRREARAAYKDPSNDDKHVKDMASMLLRGIA